MINLGKAHLENLKQKVASEVGINLAKDYNGEITTKQAGLIGGNMVKELITKAQQDLSKTDFQNVNTQNRTMF